MGAEAAAVARAIWRFHDAHGLPPRIAVARSWVASYDVAAARDALTGVITTEGTLAFPKATPTHSVSHLLSVPVSEIPRFARRQLVERLSGYGEAVEDELADVLGPPEPVEDGGLVDPGDFVI